MCLDDNAYCTILQRAPHFPGAGMDCERLNHALEENKQPYSEAMLQHLADAVNLSLDEYRAKLRARRSDNVRREFGRPYRASLAGIYFRFHEEHAPYIEGEAHSMPPIEDLDESALEMWQKQLTLHRYRHFRNRLNQGMTPEQIRSYPEHPAWLPRAEEELQVATRLTALGMRLSRQRETLPAARTYLSLPQVEMIVRSRAGGFFHRLDSYSSSALAREVLDPEDYHQFILRLDEDAELSRQRRQRMNKPERRAFKKRRQLAGEFMRQWRQEMARKYRDILVERLRQAFLQAVAVAV